MWSTPRDHSLLGNNEPSRQCIHLSRAETVHNERTPVCNSQDPSPSSILIYLAKSVIEYINFLFSLCLPSPSSNHSDSLRGDNGSLTRPATGSVTTMVTMQPNKGIVARLKNLTAALDESFWDWWLQLVTSCPNNGWNVTYTVTFLPVPV